jgi:hypothetical protein
MNMRWAVAGILVLAGGVGAFVVWKANQWIPQNYAWDGVLEDENLWGGEKPHGPVSVGLNRGPEVSDGFRGDVHPLLKGKTRLELTADWTTIGKGTCLYESAPPWVYKWYTDLRPARVKQAYTERDFSAFLPASVNQVGQLWALDSGKILDFLQQFHSRASLHLVAPGRRAGPDGAFGILRAVSPTHLDFAFRLNAEFYVTPEDWDPADPTPAWYTPAYFSGRMIVNKETGTVDYFRLGLPNDKALNVFLTVNPSPKGYTLLAHDIVRVERMELTGGDVKLDVSTSWTNALTPVEAGKRLAKVFYKFLEIDWTPFDQVAAQARARKRPIYAIVSWGATDDQSC